MYNSRQLQGEKVKNINRRIASFLLCLTVTINACGCKQDNKIDMVSKADSNNRTEDLEVLLQKNIKNLTDLGITDVVKLNDKEVDELINRDNIECEKDFNITIDELIAKIKVNSFNLANELKELDYTSFFDEDYFNNIEITNEYGYSFSKEDIALIKDDIYNALYSYLGFVLSTGTNEDIHSFTELSVVFVSDIASRDEENIAYASYSYSNNVIEICLNNILNSSYDLNKILARIDETVKHELSHVRQSACSDKLDNGGVLRLDFFNGYNHSFLIEASAESILYNLGIEGGYESLSKDFAYTYEYYRKLENKLLLCSLFNDYGIEDYYKAINDEDIEALFSYLSANTIEEKKEILSIIYTMDALDCRNNYIIKLLGSKDNYDNNDIFKVNDTFSNLHYISIFKIAISNLIKYNIDNNDLSLEDNVLLYYLISNQIADGAFLVDDIGNNNEIYCYDKFCKQYKIVQDSFFKVLSTIYYTKEEDIEKIYEEYKKIDIKDIFTNISSGVSEENIIDNNSYLFTNKLSKLLEKFPKIQEIIGNNYLYTDINEDDSLKMLDYVLADRLLIKKRK